MVTPDDGADNCAGEDNGYVYRHVLGLDEAEYERLVAAKIIVEDYLDDDRNPF